MNTAYFDHSGTATSGFYNSAAVEAHQAYRSFSQSALSLMPSASSAYQAVRSNQSTGAVDGSANYVDAACKLYDGTSNQFKSECGLTKDQNGFKATDHQMAAAGWQTSLRPSPSTAGMTTADMRSFDAAAAAACSRSVSDAWSACCNSTTVASPAVGAPPNAFYPWMAIAGRYKEHNTLFYSWLIPFTPKIRLLR